MTIFRFAAPLLALAAFPSLAAVDAAVMAKAFPKGAVRAADIHDVQVAAARAMVEKSLGDDAKDLVFVPITPCTVWDTRFATEPQSTGLIANGTTKRFFSHLDGAGGSFATWGGNPSCPEASENFIGGRPFAAMMTIYINDATANGWLTIYRDGDPDPSLATISVYYSSGPTRTQAVIAKSSRGYGSGTFDVAATSRFGSVNGAAAVTGYFIKPVNITLPNSTATTGNILKGTQRFIHNAGPGSNLFVGERAGNFVLTGGNQTGVGTEALFSLTSGQGNTAHGGFAAYSTTTGSYNVALGLNALYANTGGSYNLVLGTQAMVNGTNVAQNVALGPFTFPILDNSANNVAIGIGAGALLQLGDNNIYISSPGEAAESNTIRIGTGHTRAFLAGVRGVTTAVADAVPVMIDSNGQLGTVSSSRRVKDDIADMDAASSALMKLRPVTFHYKSDARHTPQYGLIAEEVAQVYPGLVARTRDGEAETVMYQYLPPMMLNELQKQQRRIEEQAAEIAELKAAVAKLAARR